MLNLSFKNAKYDGYLNLNIFFIWVYLLFIPFSLSAGELKTNNFSKFDSDYSNSLPLPAPTGVEALTDEERAVLEYNIGIKLLESKKYEEAYQKFFTAFKLMPNNPTILFNLGISAYETGRYEDAELAFENILELNPNLDAVKLELAKTRLILGNVQSAQLLANEVLDKDLPAEIKANIQKFFFQPEPTDYKYKKLSGFFTTGFSYDSNPRANPNSLILDTVLGKFTLSEDSEPHSDVYTYESLALDLNIPIRKSTWFWKNSLLNYNSQYEKQTDLNLNFINFNSGVMKYFSKGVWDISASFDYVFRDRRRLLAGFGSSGNLNFFLKENFILSLSGKIEKRFNYKTFNQNTGEYHSNKDRNGMHYFASFAPIYILGKNKFILAMDTDIINSNNANRPTSSRTYGLGFTYLRDFFWGISTFASIKYKHYRESRIDFLYEKIRRDNSIEYSMGVKKKLGKHLVLDIIANYNDNNSNISLYAYRQKAIKLALGYLF